MKKFTVATIMSIIPSLVAAAPVAEPGLAKRACQIGIKELNHWHEHGVQRYRDQYICVETDCAVGRVFHERRLNNVAAINVVSGTDPVDGEVCDNSHALGPAGESAHSTAIDEAKGLWIGETGCEWVGD
ncbi:hypothetical protein BJY04DRAFT_199871 [Aspergillus karnatakaensis]|uniref:uncharacterized protein n=1 Tax=Aspergillus karnatakaensis TaxID=1810916 RepID=UPI003CCDA393